MGLRPHALGAGDPVPLLQLFAQRYRSGALSPSGLAVRSRTVEDAQRSVGQTYAALGAPDPRLNSFGQLDFRLTALLAAWKRRDDPPTRVKPLPLDVIATVAHLAAAAGTPFDLAVADCLVVGFYFLLRPGEYTGTPRSHDDLFRIQDVQCWIGDRRIDPLLGTADELHAVTFVSLTFTSQKNGVRGETIGHARSGHPFLCPVARLVSRLLALRVQGGLPSTPLNAVGAGPPTQPPVFVYVTPPVLTTRIRIAVALHPELGRNTADYLARSTRAGGAMAMLCAGIDGDRIRHIGRWRSDEMYRYLHVQAQPVMNGIAAAMLRGGHFQFTPPALPLPVPVF